MSRPAPTDPPAAPHGARGLLVALRAGALGLLLLAAASAASAQQVEDSTFVPKVKKPCFTDQKPVVIVDESHANYLTIGGRYRAFAALLAADGMRVVPGVQRFSPGLLKGCQVLVVADALGAPRPNEPTAGDPAFTSSECDAVAAWVKDGGSLLLIADHAPFATAMDSLALRFGVEMTKAYAMDTRRVDPETGNVGCILFTRDRKTVADHPITRGRDRSERISRIVTFTGQSLKGPPGSTAFLVLGPSAVDLPFTPEGAAAIESRLGGGGDLPDDLRRRGAVSAAGRAQGVAFAFGKGRVVVLGEGAMFGTQRVFGSDAQKMGQNELHLGLNRPDLDNQQLALNIMHWLARVLD
jgi:hypothetical protein